MANAGYNCPPALIVPGGRAATTRDASSRARRVLHLAVEPHLWTLLPPVKLREQSIGVKPNSNETNDYHITMARVQSELDTRLKMGVENYLWTR